MDSRKYLTEPLDGAACPPYSEATCQPGRTPGRDAGGPRSGAKEGRRPWLGRRVKLRLSLLLAGPASGEALGAAAGASPSFLLPFACAVYPRPASQRRRAAPIAANWSAARSRRAGPRPSATPFGGQALRDRVAHAAASTGTRSSL